MIMHQLREMFLSVFAANSVTASAKDAINELRISSIIS